MTRCLLPIPLLLDENIRKLRLQRKWSQQQLAQNIKMSINSIQKIEQKKTIETTLSTVIKLADAFGVSIDMLIGRELREKK